VEINHTEECWSCGTQEILPTLSTEGTSIGAIGNPKSASCELQRDSRHSKGAVGNFRGTVGSFKEAEVISRGTVGNFKEEVVNSRGTVGTPKGQKNSKETEGSSKEAVASPKRTVGRISTFLRKTLKGVSGEMNWGSKIDSFDRYRYGTPALEV